MLTTVDARKIVERVDSIPLFLHAYAFHLNMRCGKVLPQQLLAIAHRHALRGVKIHAMDGEGQSLSHASLGQLHDFGSQAKALKLAIHIETSSSEAHHIDEAVRIALLTGATSVRFYPRYEGHLSEVMRRVTADIHYMKERYRDSGLHFTIEQHEDLTGRELVALVENSGWDNLSILFDFANMINANEDPLAALDTMSPHVTDVHIKDARILREQTGQGHLACKSGQGDLPFKELLTRLVCLGDAAPQVNAYGLEEEVDYYAPPFRHDGEGPDPWIPWRDMSETPMPTHDLEIRLEQEMCDAAEQIAFVRRTLAEIKFEALSQLQGVEVRP